MTHKDRRDDPPPLPGGAEGPGGSRSARLRPAVAVLAVAVALAVGYALVAPPSVSPVPSPVGPAAEPAPPGLLGGAAPFAVRAGDVVVPLDTLAVFVLPSDTLALEALYTATAEAVAARGALRRTGPRSWAWAAPPEPGLTPIRVTGAGGAAVAVQAFTLVPFSHADRRIGAYEIGDYQDEPLGGDPAYAEPAGFVEVTRELRDAPVSPHFRLGDFLAKQASGWPKYLALDPDMLVKLERLLAAVNAAGVPAEGLTVMSGYRTPAYNAAIGNTTVYSRHLYGDAAVTVADAEWLAALAEGVEAGPHGAGLVGGVGVYGPAPHRGPFVHVDTRGTAVRW